MWRSNAAYAVAASYRLASTQLTHDAFGSASGPRTREGVVLVQVLPPSYTDSDGVVGLEMGLKFLPDTGDDEIKITVK